MASVVDFRVKKGLVVTTTATIQSSIESTSTSTGAFKVVGGAGIGRDLWVGGTIYGNINGTATTSTQVNTVQRTTDSAHYLAFVDSNNATTGGELVYTTSSFVINPATGNIGVGVAAPTTKLDIAGGAKITGLTTITNTTDATSTVTGALQVTGGAGIGGNLYVHGNLNVGTANTNSSITVFNTTTSALNIRSISKFTSPNNANTITVRMLDSDVITFSGAAGQLFSISDSFTGTIFAVNDISGVPSIEVYDTGLVSLAEFTGNVGIGTTSTIAKLDVNGNVRITGITTVTNVTNATSTTTGALQVSGGAGIGRDLWVGGTIYGAHTGVSTTATNIAGGTTGSIPYQSAAGITQFIGIGAAGSLLQSNGTTATWITTGTYVVGSATTASQINTVQQTTNSAHYLTFVDSNNAISSGELVYTTSSFVINPATGNLGIGTTSPTTRLDVAGGARITGVTTITNITNATSTVTGALQVTGGVGIGQDLWVGGTIYGNISGAGTATTATQINVVQRTTNAAHYITFVDSNNATSDAELVYTTSSLMVNPGTGNIGIGTVPSTYKLEVNGSFAAVTKSFRIDHPTKPGKKLQYGSLESPYHGIRLTGRGTVVKGVCVVKLPAYMKALVNEENINIQLTNYKHNKHLYVDDINLKKNCFTVAGAKLGKLEFFWTFTATRKDIDDLEVEA